MSSVSPNQAINNRFAIAALTVLLAVASGAQMAGAQGLVGPDQESLLPPEVVPLDPSTANSLTQQQAANRMSDTAGGAQQNVPGLSGGVQGMQQAKDFRNQAFNQLYNQQPAGQLPQWRAGQAMTPQQAPVNQQVPGLNGGPNPMVAQNQPYSSYQPGNTQPPQSQTLSGGAKQQAYIQNTQRRGLTNGLSGLATLGMGALMSGYLIRSTNPLVGLGIFGTTMTGFGVRNGFRL